MKRRISGPSVSFFAFQDIITAVVGIFILVTIILVLELTLRVESASRSPQKNLDQMQETIDSLAKHTDRLTIIYEERIQDQTQFADVNQINRPLKIKNTKARIVAAVQQFTELQQRITDFGRVLESEQAKEVLLLRESQKLEGDRDLIAELKQELARVNVAITRLESVDGLVYRDRTEEGRSLAILNLTSNGIQIIDSASRSTQSFDSVHWPVDFKLWVETSDVDSRHFLLLVHPSGTPYFDEIHGVLAKSDCVYGFDVVAENHVVQLGFQWEQQQ